MRSNRNNTFERKILLKSETGTIIKNKIGRPAIALITPNSYFVGMSNLGFQTIYKLFNADVDCVCERVFLDSLEPKQPLRTLETNRPVHESDLVAFSISFENDYLNIPSLLHQANIPLLAMDRREHDPLVLAGGTAITINPEPVRPFFDAFFIGEAEEAIPSLLEVLNSGRSRRDKLERLSQIDGCVASHQVQNLQKRHDMICPSAKSLPAYNIRVDQEQLTQYRRHHIENLNRYPTHTVIHTPHTEFGDTSLIEVQKGCDYGCKFCAECFVAAPFRERSLDMIQSQICRALKHRKRIGLIGTSLLKHADFQGICEFIHAAGGTFTPSSLRANDLTDSVIALLTLSGHKTVSLAPEAGTDRLRFSLNKKITNSVLLEKIRLLADAGMHRIKLYFMIGLPHETDEDVAGLIDLVRGAHALLTTSAKKSRHMTRLILSINPFVPKPRTPFAQQAFAETTQLHDTMNHIRKSLRPLGNLVLHHESIFLSLVQAWLANGTSEVNQLILSTFESQGNLKKALKKISYED